MDDKTVPQPVPKRADQLVIGDRIQPGYLPAYARSGEARVMLVDPYHYQQADWIFVAFACADGDRNCAYYLPGGEIKVIPADTGLSYSRADDGETTQPIGGRVPAQYGALVNEGGHTAVAVGGGLIEIDPPVCLGRDMDCGRTLPCPNHPADGVVRCATSDPHAPHRTTFAAEMGITNGMCPGRCTQVCIDMAVPSAPQDARKGWHDDDCPAVVDIADVR